MRRALIILGAAGIALLAFVAVKDRSQSSGLFRDFASLLNGQSTPGCRGTHEGMILRNMQVVINVYMEETGGRVPSGLSELRDYIDLPSLLTPETDKLGPFQGRYTFLPPQARLEVPGQAVRQLLLLSTKAFPNGTRGAVWRYPNGEYSAGLIGEKELQSGVKGFELLALKPMGGVVPAPTHPFPEPGMTDYQVKILRLEYEAKLKQKPQTKK